MYESLRADEGQETDAMAKKGGKRHSAEEIVKKLREAEALIAAGKQIAEVVQQLGVSEQTYYRWKTKYGGLKQGEAKRLEELEQENRRLNRLLADAELDKSILKEALEGNY